MIRERTLFSRPDCFMTVRHLILGGTNFQIGEQLGKLAIERYGKTPRDYEANALFAETRKAYFQQNYPIHWERVRGVAKAFGLDANDNRYDLTGLPYNMDMPMPAAGCSVVYYPPTATSGGGGYLSRNYDFTIGSIADVMQSPQGPEPETGLPPLMSEPYVVAWHPEDGGYASLAIHGFDILSGTLDGMNSAGLAVAILAEDDVIALLGPNLEPHLKLHQAVGLHELQVMRFLLDSCATAREARVALLSVKQYYSFAPCHYIVADEAGDSFVYENSMGRNVQHVLDGNGRPQIVTNFQLHKHPHAEQIAVGSLTLENNAFWRYRMLHDRIVAHAGAFTPEDMKATNACVDIRTLIETMRADPVQRDTAAGIPTRTLWHGLYDQKARTAAYNFYLGEEEQPNGSRADRRSEYLRFSLDATVSA